MNGNFFSRSAGLIYAEKHLTDDLILKVRINHEDISCSVNMIHSEEKNSCKFQFICVLDKPISTLEIHVHTKTAFICKITSAVIINVISIIYDAFFDIY